MAHILSILSAQPAPQPGERTVLVRMSVHPRQGWRISAVSDQGRDIGRWVSECARTITDMAFSWMSGFGWEIAEHPQTTHSFADAFEKAETAPDQKVEPKLMFDVLLSNFERPGVAKPVESRQSRMIAGPSDTPIRRRSEAVAPVDEQEQDHEAPARTKRDVDEFLREAGKALQQGGDPGAVQTYMLTYFFEGEHVEASDPPDATDLAKFIRTLRKGLREDWGYEDIQRSVLGSLSVMDLDEPEEPGLPDQQVRRVRPIMPDEDVAALGLTDEQRQALEQLPREDPGLREKMNRTLAMHQQAVQAAGSVRPNIGVPIATEEETMERIRIEKLRVVERKERRERAAQMRIEAERLEAELAAEAADESVVVEPSGTEPGEKPLGTEPVVEKPNGKPSKPKAAAKPKAPRKPRKKPAPKPTPEA